LFEDQTALPKTEFARDLVCQEDGGVMALSARAIGDVAMILGAGRKTKKDTINLGAGVLLKRKVGDPVSKDDVLATIFTDQEEVIEDALEILRKAVIIGQGDLAKNNILKARVTKDGTQLLASGQNSV